MITVYEPDGRYRPYPHEGGFIVEAFILFRGSINKITYSEPCLNNNGQQSQAPYFFPMKWVAEQKCRQLNNEPTEEERFVEWRDEVRAERIDRHDRFRIYGPDFISYTEVAPLAGTID